MDYPSAKCDRGRQQSRGLQRRVNQGWREIHAAVALTNLAGQSRTAVPDLGAARGRTREPPAVTGATAADRTRVTGRVTGPAPAPRQGSSAGPTLTSRIIQKSSHISEVQTVNVAVASGV